MTDKQKCQVRDRTVKEMRERKNERGRSWSLVKKPACLIMTFVHPSPGGSWEEVAGPGPGA